VLRDNQFPQEQAFIVPKVSIFNKQEEFLVENEREDRLRNNLEELVRSRLSLLEQDISRLQREVNESFNRLLEATDSAISVPESDGIIGQIEAEVRASIGQASAEGARLSDDIALLRDSVVELDQQRNQAEVLNSLVSRAASFAPRVVLFVVKGANAFAWAARGFDGDEGNNAIRGLSFSLQSDTVLRAALDSQQTFHDLPDKQSENHLLLSRLGKLEPQRVLTVPLKVRRKTAALLYADSGDGGDGVINVEAIELMVHSAGIVVELVSLRARMSESVQPPARPSAQESPKVEPSRPLTESLTRPSAELQPSPPEPPAPVQQEAPPPEKPSAAMYPPEPPVAVAPPEPEPPAPSAPTFFKPATEPTPSMEAQFGVVTEQAEPASAPPVAQSVPEEVPTSSMSEEEERMHNDAKRFARLLVSEIKLYNEQRVSEGRRSNDLYERLKEDIDRSRQMYEKRVTPAVASKSDYFYEELVKTLAEGNPDKLGASCPGPTVGV